MRRHRLVSALCARDACRESVTTRAHFDASPQAVWRCLVLYEDVPGRVPWLLRAALPRPLRTEGDRTRVGNRVRCVYATGDLVKRIVTVDPAHLLRFEVVEQRLGIERCVRAERGSYRVVPCGPGTDVIVVTEYLAYLHPRRLWRPVEALVVRRLHRHILAGIGAALRPRGSVTRVAVPAPRRSPHGSSGGFA